jgi:hypothetical protein
MWPWFKCAALSCWTKQAAVWLQAPQPLLHWVLHNDLDRCKEAWQDPSESLRAKAFAAYYAMHCGFAPLAAWMLNQSDLTTEALVSMNREISKDVTVDHLLLVGRTPSIVNEPVLKAVIARRLQFKDSNRWWEVLTEVGGQELVLDAIDSGYACKPSLKWEKLCMSMGILDKPFIASLAERKVPTVHLSLALAVESEDLQFLQDTLAGGPSTLGSRPCDRGVDFLRAALRRGWAPGADLLLESFGCPIRRATQLLEAAMAGSSRACLDLLLGQGPAWKMTAVTQAMVGGHFEALEHVLQNSCLPQGGGRLQFLGTPGVVRLEAQWFDPQGWVTTMGDMVMTRSKDNPLAKRDSVMAFYTAYVVSLLDPRAAEHLGPEVSRWRAGIFSLLTWWGRRSQAWAMTHPQGPCHCPEIVLSIIESAGLGHPNLWSRARKMANIIRGWTQSQVPLEASNARGFSSLRQALSCLKSFIQHYMGMAFAF